MSDGRKNRIFEYIRLTECFGLFNDRRHRQSNRVELCGVEGSFTGSNSARFVSISDNRIVFFSPFPTLPRDRWTVIFDVG